MSTLRTVMETSPVLAKAAADARVYKAINMRILALHPLTTVHMYKDIMERALASGNVEAHYIKAIVEYFHNDNQEAGLHFLKVAAQGSYTDGIYLYGIILCCRGQMEEGTAYLDSLGWRENMAKGDRTWKSIKRTLHGVQVRELPIYKETLYEIGLTLTCEEEDIRIRCDDCYYFKQMAKFVFMI
ncbi:unnamed protein product [Microthlaspi erraticum]|nr:unnamed protein product [Microthlaspi erraticum]